LDAALAAVAFTLVPDAFGKTLAVDTVVAFGPMPNTPAYETSSPFIVTKTMNPMSRKNAMVEVVEISGSNLRQSRTAECRPLDAYKVGNDNQHDTAPMKLRHLNTLSLHDLFENL
jgi:hypothetical protein